MSCVVVVAVPTRDLWAGFPQDYVSMLHQWYCGLGHCCESGDCRITNNITGTRQSGPLIAARLLQFLLTFPIILSPKDFITENTDFSSVILDRAAKCS